MPGTHSDPCVNSGSVHYNSVVDHITASHQCTWSLNHASSMRVNIEDAEESKTWSLSSQSSGGNRHEQIIAMQDDMGTKLGHSASSPEWYSSIRCQL